MMDNFSGHIPHKLLGSIVVAGLELNLYITSRQYIMTKILETMNFFGGDA